MAQLPTFVLEAGKSNFSFIVLEDTSMRVLHKTSLGAAQYRLYNRTHLFGANTRAASPTAL